MGIINEIQKYKLVYEHCLTKIFELLDLKIWQYQEPELTKEEIDEIYRNNLNNDSL